MLLFSSLLSVADILFIGLTLCLGYIIYSDVRFRRIPNWSILLGIALVAGHILPVWETVSSDHWLQILFIALVGFVLYTRLRIGAGDIKLFVLLACFCLASPGPFVFLGNTGVLTFLFVLGYLIGALIQAAFHKGLRTEMLLYISYKKQQSALIYLFKRSKTLKEQCAALWKKYALRVGIWCAIILDIVLLRFFIHTSLVLTFPSLHIFTSATGTICLFFFMMPFLKKYYAGKHKKYLFLLTLFCFLFFFGKNWQQGTLPSFLSDIGHIGGYILLIQLIFVCFFALWNFFLLFCDRKRIQVSTLRPGDILNIFATGYLYRGSSHPFFHTPHFQKSMRVPLIPVTKTLSRSFIAFGKKETAFASVYIQNSLPYAIFIIGSFYFSLFSGESLAGYIVDFLSSFFF